MRNRRLATALVTVVLGAGALAACGGSSQSSAAAQVCTDRTNLSKAVDSVVTDLKDLNLGQAKDGLTNVQDAFNQLQKSASKLKSEEQKTLEPQIDQLKSDLADLKNVQSLSDLQAGWSKVTTQFQSISNQIVDTLKCPS